MNYKDIPILFEDNHILVVVKPMGVPVQGDESGDPDMLTLLKEYLVETYSKPGEAYLGLVHRLDRPTGGVMVFAKTSKAASRLSEAIKKGEVDKRYLTVVDGVPRFRQDKLISWLKKLPSSNTVVVVPELTEGAKYAELDYKVLETNAEKNISLLRVDLVTGRAHQIRVQMAQAGTPVLGDLKYGRGERFKLPLCLWAAELRFAHPVSGKTMDFRVYPPERLPWTLFNVERYLGITISDN